MQIVDLQTRWPLPTRPIASELSDSGSAVSSAQFPSRQQITLKLGSSLH